MNTSPEADNIFKHFIQPPQDGWGDDNYFWIFHQYNFLTLHVLFKKMKNIYYDVAKCNQPIWEQYKNNGNIRTSRKTAMSPYTLILRTEATTVIIITSKEVTCRRLSNQIYQVKVTIRTRCQCSLQLLSWSPMAFIGGIHIGEYPFNMWTKMSQWLFSLSYTLFDYSSSMKSYTSAFLWVIVWI